MSGQSASRFKGSYAEQYDQYLVPMFFASYAEVLADRVKALERFPASLNRGRFPEAQE